MFREQMRTVYLSIFAHVEDAAAFSATIEASCLIRKRRLPVSLNSGLNNRHSGFGINAASLHFAFSKCTSRHVTEYARALKAFNSKVP